MQYHAYELAYAWITPMRAAAQGTKLALDLHFNPFDKTLWRRQTAAACDVFEGLTRRYGKPEFGHYGAFNGTRWRTETQPRIRDMIRSV